MELKDFVSQVLTQIVEGVKAAQEGEDERNGVVNPLISTGVSEIHKQGHLLSIHGQVVQVVKFDVAVTVEEGTGTKGGIGVFAGAIGLGSQGESKASQSSVSRIQFEVPISLPFKPHNPTAARR
jgi:hypothetical protein